MLQGRQLVMSQVLEPCHLCKKTSIGVLAQHWLQEQQIKANAVQGLLGAPSQQCQGAWGPADVQQSKYAEPAHSASTKDHKAIRARVVWLAIRVSHPVARKVKIVCSFEFFK